MEVVPEIIEYDSLVSNLELSFNHAVESMGLRLGQALMYAEEDRLRCSYEPFEAYIVEHVALLKVGHNHGIVISRSDMDGEYILDEVGRKYNLCKDSLDRMLGLAASDTAALRADLELVLKLYEGAF